MRLPVLFLGHGSPMNILEKNKWTENWKKLGYNLLNIDGIVMISAHWFTKGTLITESENPETIHDMFGFPKEIYEKKYKAKNPKILRDRVKNLLGDKAKFNDEWGYDHGMYTILFNMYPLQDIPVLQVSINAEETSEYHYKIGELLKPLRDENILIIGSGNIVHNLKELYNIKDYTWAKNFDDEIRSLVKRRRVADLINMENNINFERATVSGDHYYPFMTVLGATDDVDDIKVINKDIVGGSLSMTSYLWGFDKYIFGVKSY